MEQRRRDGREVLRGVSHKDPISRFKLCEERRRVRLSEEGREEEKRWGRERSGGFFGFGFIFGTR